MAKRKGKTGRPRTTAPPRRAEPSRRDGAERVESPRSIVQKLIPVLLIAVGLAAYQNSWNGPFFFDDYTVIRDNPHIGELWPPWAWQPRGESAVSWRPIASLSLAINYALGGTLVQGYHVFNVTAHLIAGLVLFGIVRRTLAGERLRDRYGRQAPWLAMAIALIWLVHPLQTETVDYIVQRTELLMGLFYLLTLYCVIRTDASPHRGIWSVVAIGACALGMGCKEVMVTAPVVVLAYDRIFLSRSFSDVLRRRGAVYVGLAATWLIFLYRIVKEGGMRSDSAGFGLGAVTPFDYARTQTGVIAHYLRLAVWPHPLAVDYYDWPVSKAIGDVAPYAAVVLILLGATVWALRWRPTVGFLGVWFFLILAPTSSILVLSGEFAAERRMYLPLISVIALVVLTAHAGLELLFRRVPVPGRLRVGLSFILLFTLVAVLGAVTLRRNDDYRSDLSIWLATIAARPDNARAHSNAGTLLFRQGRLAEAFPHFSDAVRLQPNYPEARNNLGAILYERGQTKEAQVHLTEAIRLRPGYADAHANLGAVLHRQGQTADAIVHYSEAIRLKPTHALAHSNLGLALMSQGKLDEAGRQFEAALKLDPNRQDTRRALDDLKRAANQSGGASR
jgi:tetratricopeptide (TPR) repeat protein